MQTACCMQSSIAIWIHSRQQLHGLFWLFAQENPRVKHPTTNEYQPTANIFASHVLSSWWYNNASWNSSHIQQYYNRQTFDIIILLSLENNSPLALEISPMTIDICHS